jgi:uncharacterized protein with PQ loop repeat
MSRSHPVKHKRRKTLIVRKATKPRLVDHLTYFAAVAEPLVTIPQVYAIFSTKDASGISISAWLGFECFTTIWIWYALVHKEKMILVYQGLFWILDGMVIIGAILYSGHW